MKCGMGGGHARSSPCVEGVAGAGSVLVGLLGLLFYTRSFIFL